MADDKTFFEKRSGAERRMKSNPMRGAERRRTVAPPTPISSLFSKKGAAKPMSTTTVTPAAPKTQIRTVTPTSGPSFTHKAKYVERQGERRAGNRTISPLSERRSGADRRASGVQTERDLRVAATSGAATATDRGTIVSAQVRRPRAPASTVGEGSHILRKAGRLGKLATAGIAAYGAYKAWKGNE